MQKSFFYNFFLQNHKTLHPFDIRKWLHRKIYGSKTYKQKNSMVMDNQISLYMNSFVALIIDIISNLDLLQHYYHLFFCTLRLDEILNILCKFWLDFKYIITKY